MTREDSWWSNLLEECCQKLKLNGPGGQKLERKSSWLQMKHTIPPKTSPVFFFFKPTWGLSEWTLDNTRSSADRANISASAVPIVRKRKRKKEDEKKKKEKTKRRREEEEEDQNERKEGRKEERNDDRRRRRSKWKEGRKKGTTTATMTTTTKKKKKKNW